MKHSVSTALFSLAWLSLVPAIRAQTTQPNPIAWPLGSLVPSTLANDTSEPFAYQFCSPTVTDANGNFVTFGFCLQSFLMLGPCETSTSYWNQTDQFGQQVAPGTYFVNGVPYDIGSVSSALQPLGTPRIGCTRHIELTAPSEAGRPYVLAAASTATLGIDLGCSQTFPLDFDNLLVQSLTNPNTFQNFIGTLDGMGRTSAPAIAVPANPSLVGIEFELAFMTFDFAAPCSVGLVSDAYHVALD